MTRRRGGRIADLDSYSHIDEGLDDEQPTKLARLSYSSTGRSSQRRHSGPTRLSAESNNVNPSSSGVGIHVPSRSRRVEPDVVVSNVVVNCRLARLKVELMNMLLVIPHKLLLWPELTALRDQPATEMAEGTQLNDVAVREEGLAVEGMVVEGMAVEGMVVETLSPGSSETAIQQAETREIPIPEPVMSTGEDSSWEAREVEGVTTGEKETIVQSDEAVPSVPSVLSVLAVPTDAVSVDAVEAVVGEEHVDTADRGLEPVPELVPESILEPVPESILEPEREVSRRAQRRLMRQECFDRFVAQIQDATTPQDLIELVLQLETLLPAYLLQHYRRAALPSEACCVSLAAVRIFGLDRALRYEDVNIQPQTWRFKQTPRTKFSPRCLVQDNCTKAFCHTGRCNNAMIGFSRYRELTDSTAQDRSSLGQNMELFAADEHADLRNGQFGEANMNVFPGDIGSLSSRTQSLANALNAKARLNIRYNDELADVGVEFLQPYVPKIEEVTEMECV